MAIKQAPPSHSPARRGKTFNVRRPRSSGYDEKRGFVGPLPRPGTIDGLGLNPWTHRPRPRVRRGDRGLISALSSTGWRLWRGTWAGTSRPINCINTLTLALEDLVSSTTSARDSRLWETTRTRSPGLKHRRRPPWRFKSATRRDNAETTSSGTGARTPSKCSQPETWGAPLSEGFPSVSGSHRTKRYPGKRGTWALFPEGATIFTRGEKTSKPI